VRLIIENIPYQLFGYSIAFERIRMSDTKTPYTSLAAFDCLKAAFTMVSSGSTYDKELLILSEYNIDSIKIFSISKLENGFGIEIVKTDHSLRGKIIMTFAIDNSSDSIVLQQMGSKSLFSRKVIEELINSILDVFSLISKEEDFFQSTVQNMPYSKQTKYMQQLSDKLISEIEKYFSRDYIQLNLFQDSINTIEYDNSGGERYSASVFSEFEVNHFLLDTRAKELMDIYSRLETVMPKETVLFSELPLEKALVCEMISSALCHQMNWDFLRNAILKKTLENPDWLNPIDLISARAETINDLLNGYSRADRIRAQERAELLQMIGTNFAHLKNLSEIFVNPDGSPLVSENIRESLLTCTVFSSDPIEKKLQLLLQKLCAYSGFENMGNFCQPTIDYHLIRSFLRRGFLLPKSKKAQDIITSNTIREERTVGAIRKHCADIVVLLSSITQLSISTVNNIEWWIGRTICDDNTPDCLLEIGESAWLRQSFMQCPFRSLCGHDSFLAMAPNYAGNSY